MFLKSIFSNSCIKGINCNYYKTGSLNTSKSTLNNLFFNAPRQNIQISSYNGFRSISFSNFLKKDNASDTDDDQLAVNKRGSEYNRISNFNSSNQSKEFKTKKKPNWRQRREKILREFFFPSKGVGVGGKTPITEREFDEIQEIREQLKSHPAAHLGATTDLDYSNNIINYRDGHDRNIHDINVPKGSVTAYCIAEAFDFDKLYLHLAKISPQVTLTSPMNSNILDAGIISRPYGDGEGEVFYFEGGSIVCWSTTNEENQKILSEVKPFLINPSLHTQTETMSYLTSTETGLIDDLISLSNTAEEKELTRQKLAFSYGMHNSVKLAFLEENTENAIMKIQNIPDLIVANSSWAFFLGKNHREEVKKQLSEVLKLRGHINLYSELLETPDMFWEEPQLEYYFNLISRNLEISNRIAVVNKRLDYSHQVIETLRTQLSEEHSTRLEWLIIVLIAIEVVQGMLRLH